MGCIERDKYELHVLLLLGFQREHFQLGRFERGRHEPHMTLCLCFTTARASGVSLKANQNHSLEHGG